MPSLPATQSLTPSEAPLVLMRLAYTPSAEIPDAMGPKLDEADDEEQEDDEQEDEEGEGEEAEDDEGDEEEEEEDDEA